MERIFLDSSAYVKAFSREEGTDTIEKLLTLCEGGEIELVISCWAINETISAIDRKFRRGEISKRERDTIIATVLERTDELARRGVLILVPVTQEMVTNSIRYIVGRHLSAGDALQLQTAITALCTTLIAADKHLIKAAKQEGIPSYNIENKEDQKNLIEKYET